MGYICDELGMAYDLPIKLQVDNAAAIAFADGHVWRTKMKHSSKLTVVLSSLLLRGGGAGLLAGADASPTQLNVRDGVPQSCMHMPHRVLG